MEMEGLDEVYKYHRFLPTHQEALTYFLPRLLAGETLPYGADKLIHRAEVYGACEPRDLARQFAPVPTAVHTGDRFFFTTCKGKNGRFARGAGAGGGTWTINKTADVYHEGAKVGEARNLSFKKDKVRTGWVMEEFRCLLPEAVVDGGEKVLCKIHLAPTAPAAARQESAAYFKLRQEPAQEAATVPASEHAWKRPAPIAAAAADPSSCKKTRMAAPAPAPVPEPEEEYQYEDCPMLFPPAAPVSLPAESREVLAAAEADDDTGRFSCSWEQLFGEQKQEQPLQAEAENSIEHLVLDQDMDQIDMDELAAAIDRESEAHQTVGTMVVQEEPIIPPIGVEGNIEEIDIDAPIDWESLDLQSLLAPFDWEEEAAELAKRCNYNAEAGNLHAPALHGQNQFLSFGAIN